MSDLDLYIFCPVCNKSVKNKNLKRHLRKIHDSSIDDNKRPIENTTSSIRDSIPKDHRKSLSAKINQGVYDDRDSLLRLMKNAERYNEVEILKAVQQRLKKNYPALYRRHVGPLSLRNPLGSKNCYCAIPSSIHNIAHDIMNQTIPKDALKCDACWDLDITYTWGVYGQWGAKVIDTPTWKLICHERGDIKYATA
ncbi:hypothetical protein [Photobacterium leiognathi]|uniref:hypothetical protein n=1 Tax=Photobacterium leiognathi TaxID=553611 RepID=UPI002981D598|nr:hypothetical protein [Photobacterium leiognathi]